MSNDVLLLPDSTHAENPWHHQFNRSVALRSEGVPGRPTLTVRVQVDVPPRYAVVEAFFGRNSAIVDEYDMLWAWRCGCYHAWEVLFRTVHELPTELGYHAACPMCGAAPLEITL